jgi:hypothetical protein
VHSSPLEEQKLASILLGALEFFRGGQGAGCPGFLVVLSSWLVSCSYEQHGVLMERRHQLDAEQHSKEKMNLHGCK